MVRNTKILLVSLVALWGILGLVGNLMNLSGAYDMVLGTMRMPGFAPESAPPWAGESPVIATVGVTLIVLGKLLPAVLCSWGAVRMTAARRLPEEPWQRAKSVAVAGCALTLACLFFGWIVIGEFVFMMFLDPGLTQATQAAFRYGGFIGLIMLFVAQRE